MTSIIVLIISLQMHSKVTTSMTSIDCINHSNFQDFLYNIDLNQLKIDINCHNKNNDNNDDIEFNDDAKKRHSRNKSIINPMLKLREISKAKQKLILVSILAAVVVIIACTFYIYCFYYFWCLFAIQNGYLFSHLSIEYHLFFIDIFSVLVIRLLLFVNLRICAFMHIYSHSYYYCV